MLDSNIFLIDDDSVLNYLNSEMIRKESPRSVIRVFENAENAIEVLKDIIIKNNERFPELIFIDINMPNMDAWEFLELFHQFQLNKISNCKIVIQTSSSDPIDLEKSKKYASVLQIVSKPLTPAILQMVFNA
jgi:CheY-like chemotaxis protein